MKNEHLKQLSHAGFVWKKKLITASGLVDGIGKNDIFGGIITQVPATSTTLTVYDAASAVADDTIIPTTTTGNTNVAGAFTSPFGGAGGLATTAPNVSAGVLLEKGLFISIGGTGSPKFWVLYR